MKKFDITESSEPKTRSYANSAWISVYIIIIFIVFIIIWAFFANIDVVVNANGKIIPSGQTKIIQNLEGGIVKSILVKEGQRIKKGQPLLKLDDTQFLSDYKRDKVKLAILDAEIIVLNAQINNQDKVEFPEELQKNYPKVVENAKNYFYKNHAALQENLNTLYKTQELIQQELDILRPLTKEQIVSSLDLISRERQYFAIQSTIQDKIDEYRSRARESLRKAEQDKRILEETFEATKDRLQRRTLYSPIDGIVHEIAVTTIGEVVAPSEKIMVIVPIHEPFEVIAYVKPMDIGKILKGQTVQIEVSAYEAMTYGRLEGKVATIYPDTTTDDKGDVYYKVLIKPNKQHIGDDPQKGMLAAGMPVSVDIITGERTIMSYIFSRLTS